MGALTICHILKVGTVFDVDSYLLLNLKYMTLTTKVTNEEKCNILNIHLINNYTTEELSRLVGRGVKTVRKILKEADVPLTPKSPTKLSYTIDENYFNCIDSSNKAYILGFLYADGCISKNNLSCNLQEGDIDILKGMCRELKTDKKLIYSQPAYRKFKGKEYLCKGQWTFRIANKQLCNSLRKLGVIENKTNVLKFPTEEQVPYKFVSHFIRGYFDGDGCVYTSDIQSKITITGTIDLLEGLREVLVRDLGFRYTKLYQRYKDIDNNIRTMEYGGAPQCIKFREFIYKDADIYLARKKDKLDAIISKGYSKYNHDPICIEDGCDGLFFCKGYCKKHYDKHKRTKNEIHREEGTME